ncbi:ferrochelatase [Salmonella enterica subsp. enterica]|uniref:Ferrochelatase n=1 Tax=Salmonella enterica I TaxID=59201 RepID=A0A447U8H4_SALET|nr:ferrochelatase [Salmonella enterica subsp. enterica]
MRQTKTGILLANLGTPDAPTPEAVKRYLKQFFKRQTRGGYSSSAVVAAAAWRYFTAAFAARRETLSIYLDGWRFAAHGI